MNHPSSKVGSELGGRGITQVRLVTGSLLLNHQGARLSMEALTLPCSSPPVRAALGGKR